MHNSKEVIFHAIVRNFMSHIAYCFTYNLGSITSHHTKSHVKSTLKQHTFTFYKLIY